MLDNSIFADENKNTKDNKTVEQRLTAKPHDECSQADLSDISVFILDMGHSVFCDNINNHEEVKRVCEKY